MRAHFNKQFGLNELYLELHPSINKLINFSSEKELTPGDLVMVKINDAKTWSLDGEAVE